MTFIPNIQYSMGHITALGNVVVATKGMFIDVYNISDGQHIVFSIPRELKVHEQDYISNVALSLDCKHIAILTASSKRLFVYDFTFKEPEIFILPRAASKVRFTVSGNDVIVADKTGDVLSYSLKDEKKEHSKLLGHLSLLLDVLQSDNGKFIITADRDEKIRVTNYPNTYNIQTYCLGHKEFVNHIELLPNDKKFLISTSGDGTIKIWNYQNGQLHHNINTYEDVKDDDDLCKDFIKSMDEEAIEVQNLPVVHFACSQLTETQSLIAVTILSIKKILIYSIETTGDRFSHKLQQIITLNVLPSDMCFNKELIVYFQSESCFDIYGCEESNKIKFKLLKNISVFDNQKIDCGIFPDYGQIKVLYKKKYDNMLEYQERKRQRLNNK